MPTQKRNGNLTLQPEVRSLKYPNSSYQGTIGPDV